MPQSELQCSIKTSFYDITFQKLTAVLKMGFIRFFKYSNEFLFPKSKFRTVYHLK